MNRTRFVCFVSIFVLAGVGGALRFWIASHDHLWLDELHTAWATGGSWSEVAPRAAAGNQSPLYFWAVWCFRQFFGDSDLSLRGVSLIAGIAVVFAGTHLLWEWTKSLAATTTGGVLLAINSDFVFYATEARPYVFLQLLGLLQVIVFWNLLREFGRPQQANIPAEATSTRSSMLLPVGAFSLWRYSVVLVLLSSLLVYSHVTSVWLFVAQLIFVLGYLYLASRNSSQSISLKTAVLVLGIVAVLTAIVCIPAFSQIGSVYGRRANWELISSPEGLLAEVCWPLLLGIALPIVCAMVFSIGGSFGNSSRSHVEPRDASKLRLVDSWWVRSSWVLMWALIPIACIWLADVAGIAPLALSRYAIIGSVAIPIFAGLCVALPSNRYRQLAIALILIGTQLYFNPYLERLIRGDSIVYQRGENWRDPIHEINQNIEKQHQPVFLFANLIEDCDAFTTDQTGLPDAAFLEYLKFPLNGIEILDAEHRTVIAGPTISHQHFRQSDIELMKAAGGGWIIVRGYRPLATSICHELQNLAAEINQGEPPLRIREAQFPSQTVHLFSVEW